MKTKALMFLNGVTLVTIMLYCLVLVHVIKLVGEGYTPLDGMMVGWVVALILVTLLAIGDRQFFKLHIQMWQVAEDNQELRKEIKDKEIS